MAGGIRMTDDPIEAFVEQRFTHHESWIRCDVIMALREWEERKPQQPARPARAVESAYDAVSELFDECVDLNRFWLSYPKAIALIEERDAQIRAAERAPLEAIV